MIHWTGSVDTVRALVHSASAAGGRTVTLTLPASAVAGQELLFSPHLSVLCLSVTLAGKG